MNVADKVYERLKYLKEAGGDDSNPNDMKLARVYPVVVPSSAPVCFPIVTYAMAGGSDNPALMRGSSKRQLVRISVIGKESDYRIIQETMDAVIVALRSLFYVEPDPIIDSYNEIIDTIEQTIHVIVK